MSVIDEASNTVTATVHVAANPCGLGVDHAAGTVYVVSSSGVVSVISEDTNTVTATIRVGTNPTGVAVNPLSHTAYVASYDDNTVSVISGAAAGTGPIVSGYRATKCADGKGGSAKNDTPVVMWDCNGSAEQDWAIEPDGTIQAANGKCLDIYREQKTNNAPVELWTCTGRANQQWKPVNGTLVNPASGKCLDDPRFNTANGTQLGIYTCNGGANQQWKLP